MGMCAEKEKETVKPVFFEECMLKPLKSKIETDLLNLYVAGNILGQLFCCRCSSEWVIMIHIEENRLACRGFGPVGPGSSAQAIFSRNDDALI